MTGCYPRRIGFGDFDGLGVLFPGQPIGLNPEETSMARALKEIGYSTRIVGKWHCGDQPEFLPTNHGFDGYYGIPYSNDMGRQAGVDPQLPPLPLLRDDDVIEQQPDQATITERYVEDCVRFIRENREGPFFLYFAHMYVHLPLYVQDRFLRESKNGPYGAAVAAIDWAAGVLLSELKTLGIDDDTLMLFTSDNGSRADFGPSNGPLRGIKGTTWEGGQRVPLIARWPGHIPSGRTSAGILSAIDLLPTLASIAGATISSTRIDGMDASALLLGHSDESPRTDFAYYRGNTIEAVREGDWKLHIRKEGDEVLELYNLRDDIGERNDQHSDKPEIVSRLQEMIEEFRADLGDEATGSPGSCRPIGRIPEGRPLTEYDVDHPYYIAEYDLMERG